VALLNHRLHRAADADTVAAHLEKMGLLLIVGVNGIIFLGIFGAELEDVPDLDPVAQDDGATKVVLDITKLYRDNKSSYETHILHTGGHGFNMGDRSDKVTVKTWVNRFLDWMDDQGLLSK
jgi:hypothetical protein